LYDSAFKVWEGVGNEVVVMVTFECHKGEADWTVSCEPRTVGQVTNDARVTKYVTASADFTERR
jgi:hypothetical protein